MKASLRHYLFGKEVRSEAPLEEKDITSLVLRALEIKERLRSSPLDRIIAVLDRAGRRWADKSYGPRKKALAMMPLLTGFHPTMVERALETLAALLSRSELEKKVATELGTPGALDRWVRNGPTSVLVKALPLGLVLHVSAGNVFIGGIDSLVHGLLTKNVNILKFSGDDPLFPLLFAESLREVDDEGLVSGSFSLLSFRGGERAVEEALKKACDAVVVWGGEKAVEAYRSDLPLSCELVSYGPKYSLALVTRRGLTLRPLKEICRALALDVAMWEQRACSSPQVLYVEAKPQGAVFLKFLSALEEALARISRELPQGELTMDEEIELLKYRERAVFASLLGEGRAAFPAGGTEYTVIVEHDPAFTCSPLNRCLIVKPYSRWEEVRRALLPVGKRLQTVSFLGTGEELQRVAYDLCALGATRVTGLGRAHIGEKGAPHDGSWQLARLVRWAAIESEELASLVPEEEGSHDRALGELLHYAQAHSPYYREKLKDLAWPAVPFLERSDIYLNSPPKGTGLLTGSLEGASVFASGGSTGAPKFCIYGHGEFDEVAGVLAEVYRIAGITARDVVANLFMAGNLWTSFLAANGALEKIGSVTLPIAGNADLELIISYLDLFRPTALIGLPSVIIQLAEALEKRSRPLELKTILYGGEHLSDEVKEYLRKVFSAGNIMSAGYASVDAGPVGYQCPHCTGSVHHLLTEYQVLEVIDPETGGTAAPGVTGELVITNLKRRLMPVIRYRTGDAGRLIEGQCPCGRSDGLFELMGRCDDVVRVGTVSIYPDEIEHHLAAFPAVSHLFQIVAKSAARKDHLVIRVESRLDEAKDQRYLAGTIRRAILEGHGELAEALREKWLGSLSVEIVPKGSLPRVARTGKIKKVLDLRRHDNV
ncbi:MAG: acyl-CoA reductase [Candidatus Eremiobacteraeota bacterium]|nr:acyl-CoA reductase [Candidatus Eremiobacteraeota bacterium]